VVYVHARADDAPTIGGQGDGVGGGAGGAGEDAQVDEAAIAMVAMEADVVEASCESETPHQTEV
jgi:hypothetical protein